MSEKYLQTPFEREFNDQVSHIFGPVNQVDLKQTEELMVQLGFVVDNSDRIDLFKLWELMAQGQQLVNLSTLFNTLLNVQNIRGASDPKECRKLHHRFGRLFRNRELLLRQRKRKEQEPPSAGPEINSHSKALAEKDMSLGARHEVLLEKGRLYELRRQGLASTMKELEVA